MFAQDSADAADDAGDVLVADDDEGSSQFGLDIDAVVVEQARGAAVQDGGEAGPVALRVGVPCSLAGPVEGEAKRGAGAAGDVLVLVFLDADAAFGCCCSSVDAVDAVGAVQHSGDGGVADELGLERREAAVVGNRDAFHAARVRGGVEPGGRRGAGGVAEELAQAVGHLHVRGDLGVLFLGQGGDVDGILHDTEFEIVAHLIGELDADGFLGLVGGAADVGREQNGVDAEEGRVFDGLLVEDVEGSAGDVARFQGFRESLFDDELAAGAVDDANAFFHDGQGGGVDEALGLGGEADVEGEVVGGLEDFVDGDQGDVVLAGDDGGDEGVVADEVLAEGFGAAGDLEADSTEADDAEGLAAS